MTDDDARWLGFSDAASHDELHRRLSLPKGDPEALSPEGRRAAKALLFQCHYASPSVCDYHRRAEAGTIEP
jgi:hypothetical protein